MCDCVCGAVGREFSDDEIAHLKAVLESQSAYAYSASSRSDIVITYEGAIGSALRYEVNLKRWTVEAAYEDWIRTRSRRCSAPSPMLECWRWPTRQPIPSTHRILDIGAGNRAHALALARRGHPVDVVEMTPSFASDDSLRRRT